MLPQLGIMLGYIIMGFVTARVTFVCALGDNRRYVCPHPRDCDPVDSCARRIMSGKCMDAYFLACLAIGIWPIHATFFTVSKLAKLLACGVGRLIGGETPRERERRLTAERETEEKKLRELAAAEDLPLAD